LAQDFATALQQADILQQQAQGAVAAKADARTALEDNARAVAARIQTHPGVTDQQRNSLGITARSTTRTPVGPPTSKPVATIDTNTRLQHTITFVDELTPSSRAKPDGVQGCEIWGKVDGPPPAGPSELKYLATDTRSPYLAMYDDGQSGKTAYYMLRWVSTRGEPGGWSLTFSAMIS
jgi:hypothetical protein